MISRKPVPPREDDTSSLDVPPAGQLNEDELHARWNEVLAELRSRQRVSLASVLETSAQVTARPGVLTIGCSNDFQLSAIDRHRLIITEVLHSVFGKRVRVEGVLKPATETGDRAEGAIDESHPVVVALKKELGAEPVD